MTTKHTQTPGPWKLLEVGDRPKLCPAAEDNTSILTIVEEDGVKFAAVYAEADARLIAAAPQMLEALQKLLAINDGHSPFGGELYQDRVDRAWDAARAAISAASPTNGEMK